MLRPATLRKQGAAIPERVAEHAALAADLNVLAFVTLILPAEIVDAPRHGSLCFHPSLLPKYRGGNALAWQILLGGVPLPQPTVSATPTPEITSTPTPQVTVEPTPTQ